MNEKYVAGAAVAVAGVAVAVGVVFASAGGVFDDSTTVRPPAIDSSNPRGVAVSDPLTSTPAVSVPPSPTWQIAEETVPKPAFTEPPAETETSTPEPAPGPTTRTRTTAARPTPVPGESDEQDETTTTRPGR